MIRRGGRDGSQAEPYPCGRKCIVRVVEGESQIQPSDRPVILARVKVETGVSQRILQTAAGIDSGQRLDVGTPGILKRRSKSGDVQIT